MENCEEGFAALRLPFGVTMSFAAVGTARFAIAQLVLQNHREHDMVPFGREHFVVDALCAPHTAHRSVERLMLQNFLERCAVQRALARVGVRAKIGGNGDEGNGDII